MAVLRPSLLLASVSLVLLLATQAFSADGFSSQTGDLPVGAGGTASFYVKEDGTVLISPTDTETKAKLDVNGGILVGRDPHHLVSDPTGPCASDLAGILSFMPTTAKLYICNGTRWTKVSLIN